VAQVTFAAEYDAGGMDYTQSYDFTSSLVVPSMTEPLFRINQEGQLTPNLATTYDLSNPRKLVMQIRPGVSFWDGSPLTAEDVAFSMQRQLDPSVASLLAFYYTHVDHVAATGPLEVTAYLKQPDVQFLLALSTNAGAVSSKAFIQKHGKQFGSPDVGTMGTGAYKYQSWKKGESFSVVRNDGYWNRAVVPCKVDRFMCQIIPDEATLLEALRSGQIDGQLNQVSGRGVASLASATNIRQYSVPSGGFSQMAFNVVRKPWDDPRVRQAVSLLIPRQGLLDSVWGGQGQLSKAPVPPSMWSFSKPIFEAAYAALPDYANTGPSNLARARQLISEAGAHGAQGSIWVQAESDAQQAEAIQAAVAQIGLTFHVNLVTAAALTAAQTAKVKPYDMVIVIWDPDLPDPANTYQALFKSNSIQNYMGWKNSQVDMFLNEQDEITNNPTARARLISKAQSVIVDSQVSPVLVSPTVVLSLNKRLGGYQLASPQQNWDPHFIGSLSGA